MKNLINPKQPNREREREPGRDDQDPRRNYPNK